MNNDQDEAISNNIAAWNQHYRRDKSRQSYPDENLVRIVKTVEAGVALDFGCGSGRHLQLLFDHGFTPVIGLDTSMEAIHMVKKLYKKADCYVLDPKALHQLDLSTYLGKQKANLIVCWGVLHYNPHDVQLNIIQQAYSHLAQGGVFAGTLRSDKDSHYESNSDINNAPIEFFSLQKVQALLGKQPWEIQIGYIERGPIGNHEQKVCHWVFHCRKN